MYIIYIIAPPRSGLRMRTLRGGARYYVEKTKQTHEGSDPIPPNSTYFQGARLTTRVSSRRSCWTGTLSTPMSTPAEACAVCKARQAGVAPPKRKCSCGSGITSHRHSVSTVLSSSRSSAQERLELRVLGLPPDLVDMEDNHWFKYMVFSD